MKFIIALSLIVAVASGAMYTKPGQLSSEMAQITEIVAAIQSPSTDPATAAALETMLNDLLGISSMPIDSLLPGPAIIEGGYPIIPIHDSLLPGPAIIEGGYPIIPIHDGGAVTAVEEPIATPVATPVATPAIVEETSAAAAEVSSSPLVQIIVNINSADIEAALVDSPVVASPAIIPEGIVSAPVTVVDSAIEVIQHPVVATPAIVPEFIDHPVVATPAIVPEFIVPGPAVIQPEILN